MAISVATVAGSGLTTFSAVYSGAPVLAYLDCGDALPGPLVAGTGYVWQVADSRGVTQTEPVTPSWKISTQPDQLSQILIRLLQGAVSSMPMVNGLARPMVSTEMPINGTLAMPFIVVNLDLIQQSEVAIGEDFPQPTPDNDWTLWALAKRVWRVTVMSKGAEERDFWRDNLLAAFRVFKATAFTPLGLNVTHSFQAASYTDAKEWEGMTPGFYGADLMLEITGIFPVAILNDFGVMNPIQATVSTTGGTEITAQVYDATLG
jgi:hypothetical protein